MVITLRQHEQASGTDDMQMLTPRLRSNADSALGMCVEYGGGGWKWDLCAQRTLLRGASRLARLVC